MFQQQLTPIHPDYQRLQDAAQIDGTQADLAASRLQKTLFAYSTHLIQQALFAVESRTRSSHCDFDARVADFNIF